MSWEISVNLGFLFTVACSPFTTVSQCLPRNYFPSRQWRIMQSSIASEMQRWGWFWFSSPSQLAEKGVFPLFYVLDCICCSSSASFVLISQAYLDPLRLPGCPGLRKIWAALIRHRRSEPITFWYLLASVPESLNPGTLRRRCFRDAEQPTGSGDGRRTFYELFYQL